MNKDDPPLHPYDSKGLEIKVGDKVKILKITDALMHDLPKEDQQALKEYGGKITEVYEIDSFGFIWVENFEVTTDEYREYRTFSLEPAVLEKV
jgi:hypothetical protein